MSISLQQDDCLTAMPEPRSQVDSTAQEQAIDETAPDGEEVLENSSRPKGVRFVILFASMLAGDFFVGYVRSLPPISLRGQAA